MKISTWNELKEVLSEGVINYYLNQGRMGDPEELEDALEDHSWLVPVYPSYDKIHEELDEKGITYRQLDINGIIRGFHLEIEELGPLPIPEN